MISAQESRGFNHGSVKKFGRVRPLLSNCIDLLPEFLYLIGKDGEKFPVFVEFDRRVDGFGLQFEPADATSAIRRKCPSHR
jgi:hypothetical protein